MASQFTASIILCTRSRVAGLKQTLLALGRVKVPFAWKVELVVVDNASTDNTAEVVQATKLSQIEVQYFYEPRKGKANALNTGLARARGDILLFIDDDVQVAEDWLAQIGDPILSGKYDVVTGQITLAPELLRPWMTPMHRWWLASSNDAQLHEGKRELIGANMGFRREVLERVPAFDPELGPGARGLGEDSLFGWQLVEAGYKIEYLPNAIVFHHLDETRLCRCHWLEDARKRGRSDAYTIHHWEHSDVKNPRWSRLLLWMKLLVKRILQPPPRLEEEGCARWELGYVWRMELCKQFCLDRKQPRNYLRRGLKKIGIPKNIFTGTLQDAPKQFETKTIIL